MFSFIPLINNLVTIGLRFVLLSISATSSSEMMVLRFFFWVVLFNVFINIIHII